MKRSELDTLMQLKGAYEKDAENIKVPESLSVDRITEKLKQTSVDPDAGKAGTIIRIRRITAVAAALVFVTVLTVFIRNNIRVNTAGVKNAFEGFELNKLVKNIKTDSELQNIINEILSSDKGGKTGTSAKGATEQSTEKPGLLSILGDEKTTEETAKVENVKATDNDSMIAQAVNSGQVDCLADTVHCSGKYIYTVSEEYDERSGRNYSAVNIIRSSPPDDMFPVAKIPVTDSSSSDVIENCRGIYVNSGTLIALVERSRYAMSGDGSEEAVKSSTVAVYFDISDPEQPEQTSVCEQEGTLMYAKLTGGKFYVATSKAISSDGVSSAPTLTVNGSQVQLRADKGEYTAAQNAKEKAVLFITAATPGKVDANMPKLALLGCGSKADVSAMNNTVYITRLFVSPDTGEKKTEIYSFAVKDGAISQSGTYSFDGTIVSGPGISEQGYIRLITSDGSTLSACVLTSGLKLTGENRDFAPAENVTVTYIGSKACVSAQDKTYILDFTNPASITAAETTVFVGGSRIRQLKDGSILSVSGPDSAGKVTLSLFRSDNSGSVYIFDASQTALAQSDSRAIVCDEKTGIFGLPVIIHDENGNEASAYALFDTSGGDINPVGIYTHDENFVGNAAVRAVCSGDILYTVSNEKVSAFSISGKETIGTVTF
ncbi:MAG: beta-propeller domain-containing protein [Clostridia bacterium]|nr:beta-propeller domain-containing protein [Clostridia bacterium]